MSGRNHRVDIVIFTDHTVKKDRASQLNRFFKRRSKFFALCHTERSASKCFCKLAVIDLTASVLCMENHMPLAVFDLNGENAIADAMQGKVKGTVITA